MKIRVFGDALWLLRSGLTICLGINRYQPFFLSIERGFFGLTFLFLDFRVNWDKNQEVIANWTFNQVRYQLPDILAGVEKMEKGK